MLIKYSIYINILIEKDKYTKRGKNGMKYISKILIAFALVLSLFTVTNTASASADSFSDYFTSSKWITRDGVVSLSVTPKSSGPLIKAPNGNARMVAASKAWTILYNKHKGSSNWKNTASMKAQFECHVTMAQSFKTPWNLEPHRTTTSLTETIKKGCNPK